MSSLGKQSWIHVLLDSNSVLEDDACNNGRIQVLSEEPELQKKIATGRAAAKVPLLRSNEKLHGTWQYTGCHLSEILLTPPIFDTICESTLLNFHFSEEPLKLQLVLAMCSH